MVGVLERAVLDQDALAAGGVDARLHPA